MTVDLAEELSVEAVTTAARPADWREAVRLAGDGLVASGATTDAYTDEMIAAVDELGPYIVIAPGLALAHSRPSPAVSRTGLSWVGLAEPVAFGHKTNDPVDLVIGLAALDHDGHIEVMSALAGVLADDEGLARLRAATTPDEVLATLHELAVAAA
ncbi:PTS sugar transporter subunit IIA [Frigoribacterium faeni]|jgi:PTS system ascorbate-specific IIA component|uniref:PTS sugar transporter subunit IIA n=1 Tax=Frigoribacterium faeni TaxID=145483 RepID=UPI00141AD098|nr:PTS sugar transporter subunit IIA [Frigoribacterium faeni]NIJ05648.1 PTS system ascorbate-specific IIA component [Frigoribacterium faeni]